MPQKTGVIRCVQAECWYGRRGSVFASPLLKNLPCLSAGDQPSHLAERFDLVAIHPEHLFRTDLPTTRQQAVR
jgi:hypothetical protein